jgi:CheY-like chemotaxis protein
MQNRKKRVLLIDDDHALTTVVKLRLEESDEFHVWTENTGSRGLLAARMFRPDVVLLDVNMPQMDGSEVAARLREEKEFSELPIVFYTGLAEEGEAVGGKNERLLAKTAEWSEVVQCLNDALEPVAA